MNVGVQEIALLCKTYNISLDWIFFETGTMQLDNSKKYVFENELQKAEDVRENYTNSKPDLVEIIKTQSEMINNLLIPIAEKMENQQTDIAKLNEFNDAMRLYFKIEVIESELKQKGERKK